MCVFYFFSCNLLCVGVCVWVDGWVIVCSSIFSCNLLCVCSSFFYVICCVCVF